MSTYKFEKLKVWQVSLTFIKDIYNLCQTLPTNENNILVNQIKRSTIPVNLNIAEGSGAETDIEFTRYIHIARKSLFEVVATLKIIEFLYKRNIESELEKAEEISKMLSGLKKYLKSGLKSNDSRLKTQVS